MILGRVWSARVGPSRSIQELATSVTWYVAICRASGRDRLERTCGSGDWERAQWFGPAEGWTTKAGDTAYRPVMAGNISRTIVMAAGPTSTTKIPGKMNNTSGKMSLTAVFAAFSSAI